MTPSPATDPLIGRLVDGRYRVRARIARGGMATVYVATDLRLERRIALKVMHGHLSDDTVFQSRFIQEARAAARLADPHVVNVFDQGQDGELAYLVMEYLPGITLRELLKEQRRLTVTQTITIMDAVLAGLAAAHRAGIVHRDVKPENVLLAEDGRIKIGDFGLARATTANTATGQQLMGTIAYLAPELVTRGTADARSDIYALGIMLYEMLTGEQPYRGEQPMQIAFQHATESVPRPSVRNPGVPESLDELVLWSTEREPDERPVDAQAMLDRLREIERELGITPQVTRREVPLTAGLAIPEDAGTGSLTTVMPLDVEPTGPTRTVDTTDNATRLRQVGRRGRRRGVWLVLVTILLAALAGTAGWWFGSGPGSLIPVPTVAGQNFEDATKTLAALNLKSDQKSEPSLKVEAGLAIRTDPPSGSRVDKDSVVTVFISSGPKEVAIETLADKTGEQAKAILSANGIDIPDAIIEEYNPNVSSGGVVWVGVNPRAGGDQLNCTEGCSAHEGDTAVMLVSLGALQDVTGFSEDAARKALQGQKMIVADESDEQYNNDYPAGQVIGIHDNPEGRNWRPGETVTLIVSLGPELFDVPDVTGLTRDEAAQKLKDNGFQVTYSSTWNAIPNGLTQVTGQSPGGGERKPHGTEITLKITVSI